MGNTLVFIIIPLHELDGFTKTFWWIKKKSKKKHCLVELTNL